jgi:hypothetical protein
VFIFENGFEDKVEVAATIGFLLFYEYFDALRHCLLHLPAPTYGIYLFLTNAERREKVDQYFVKFIRAARNGFRY